MIQSRSAARRSGFTLTELIVVIAIIALLTGILLAALGAARESGRRTKTQSIMFAFAQACEAFEIEHGFYPGVVPEEILATHIHDISHGVDHATITSTTNAILHLQGGAVRRDQVSGEAWDALGAGWDEYMFVRPAGQALAVKINPARIGDGPVIGGKPYPPYLADASAIGDLSGFETWPGDPGGGEEDGGSGGLQSLPHLLDGWGRPILYLRRSRDIGRLVWTAHQGVSRPQFYIDSLWPYTRAASQSLVDPCSGGPDRGGSILATSYAGVGEGLDPSYTRRILAKMLRSPLSNEDPTDILVPGTPRGAFMLVSAGPDGLYFSSADGPGGASRQIGSSGCSNHEAFPVEEFLLMDDEVFDQFDDIRVYGGS
ncbi:MAG: type II secretion system protein [Planctomycetota bacterium]|jgi:prepilin-type N-terminal cleavage/methylation domain-containing protein